MTATSIGIRIALIPNFQFLIHQLPPMTRRAVSCWRSSESRCWWRRRLRRGRAGAGPVLVAARERTIEALVFDVAGGPAEFSADLLIRLAGSAAVADPDWKRELLETAFLRAYGVHESHKRAAPECNGRQPGGRIHAGVRDRAGCAHAAGARGARHDPGRSRPCAANCSSGSISIFRRPAAATC